MHAQGNHHGSSAHLPASTPKTPNITESPNLIVSFPNPISMPVTYIYIYIYICNRGEHRCCRNGYNSVSYRIFIFCVFLWGNTIINPSLMMMSLCYIIDDVIYLAQNYK